jgi:hypothetical protein
MLFCLRILSTEFEKFCKIFVLKQVKPSRTDPNRHPKLGSQTHANIAQKRPIEAKFPHFLAKSSHTEGSLA